MTLDTQENYVSQRQFPCPNPPSYPGSSVQSSRLNQGGDDAQMNTDEQRKNRRFWEEAPEQFAQMQHAVVMQKIDFEHNVK